MGKKLNFQFKPINNISSYNSFFLLAMEALLLEAHVSQEVRAQCLGPYNQAFSLLDRAVKRGRLTRSTRDYMSKSFRKGAFTIKSNRNLLSAVMYGKTLMDYLINMSKTAVHFINLEWDYNNELHKKGINFVQSFFTPYDFNKLIEEQAYRMNGHTSKTYEPSSFSFIYTYESGIRHITCKLANHIKDMWRMMHSENIEANANFCELLCKLNAYSNEITLLQELVNKVSGYGPIKYEEIFLTVRSLFSYNQTLHTLWRSVVNLVEEQLLQGLSLAPSRQEALIKQSHEIYALLDELQCGIHLCCFRLCGGDIYKGQITFFRGTHVRL